MITKGYGTHLVWFGGVCGRGCDTLELDSGKSCFTLNILLTHVRSTAAPAVTPLLICLGGGKLCHVIPAGLGRAHSPRHGSHRDAVRGSLQQTRRRACQVCEHPLLTGEVAALAISRALICKAPGRQSTEPKLQHGALDSGKHGGGPQPHQDTCSFNFVLAAAGPGGPGWESPCLMRCVSHCVYSSPTNRWAECRVRDTLGARHSGCDDRFQRHKQCLQLADRQFVRLGHASQKGKAILVNGL